MPGAIRRRGVGNGVSGGIRRRHGLISRAMHPRIAMARFTVMPSTVIRSFSYDAESRTLEILFLSGRRYQYLNVPEKIYGGMRAASSKGSFFNMHVRDNYSFRRVA